MKPGEVYDKEALEGISLRVSRFPLRVFRGHFALFGRIQGAFRHRLLTEITFPYELEVVLQR